MNTSANNLSELGFSSIVKQFSIDGQFLGASPYGFGHINDTYAIRFKLTGGLVKRYILQRINHHVFKKPEEVMGNIERVTRHLRKKIISVGGDPEREMVTLIPTLEGNSYYKTPEGHYWRTQVLIEGALAYQRGVNLDHCYQASKAFGKFLRFLGDFPVNQLHVTIPDFHHTAKRFQAFVRAVESDVENRAQSVKTEIEFVMSRAEETSLLVDLQAQGMLPERVTHNDTKFDNVMIDDGTGEGVCVIDLDTVMPGLSVYDFGDSVRFGANPAAEDEQDLSKVYLDLEIFDRYAQGYLDGAGGILTSTEVGNLAFASRLITLEQSMRFLADHLNGDVYYKISRKGHNLDRCRTQLKLVSDMEVKFEQMERIVERYK